MNSTRAYFFAGVSAAILAAGSVALFVGCKNSTSADTGEKRVLPPPRVTIYPVDKSPAGSNPLTDACWKSASWYTLDGPAGAGRATPPVQAAMLYDAHNLYVAFISKTVPPPSAPILQDSVSVFLDPTGDGLEIAQFGASPSGQVTFTWIQSSVAATPRPDGTPNTMHPFRSTSRPPPPSLTATTRAITHEGAQAWTAVMTIPLDILPTATPHMPVAGAQWKINLVRSITTQDQGSGQEQLQANLSQVQTGAQALCPYRMATLLLAPAH